MEAVNFHHRIFNREVWLVPTNKVTHLNISLCFSTDIPTKAFTVLSLAHEFTAELNSGDILVLERIHISVSHYNHHNTCNYYEAEKLFLNLIFFYF
jgi:hypothetical protein